MQVADIKFDPSDVDIDGLTIKSVGKVVHVKPAVAGDSDSSDVEIDWTHLASGKSQSKFHKMRQERTRPDGDHVDKDGSEEEDEIFLHGDESIEAVLSKIIEECKDDMEDHAV